MAKKWKREDITPEVLRELLRLDEDTGKLYWKERGLKYCSSVNRMNWWNEMYAGKEAFTDTNKNGTGTGVVFKVKLSKPYVVYCIKNGVRPNGVVYMRGGEPVDINDDTRKTQSPTGFVTRKDSITGYRGVVWNAKMEKYGAKCAHKWIGAFDTPIDAAKAYDGDAFSRWGDKALLNFPEDYGLERADDEMPEGYY